MAIEELKIELERSFALDDSCQMMFWAKGHHAWGDFITAIEAALKAEERDDIPLWVISQAPFKQSYQRSVPCSGSIVADRQFVYQDQPGRGATPVTILDFWLPIHRPQMQLPSAKEAPAVVDEEPPTWTPNMTGVGDLCAPGPADEQEALFLLRFDDADRSDAIYRDRTSAREAFAKAEGRGWNCYLFELMPRSYGQECTSKAAAGQAVELTKDQLAAIQFYNLNPSAAQVDLESRLSRSVEDRRPVTLPVGEVVQTGGLRGGPKRYKVKWLSDAALVNGTQLYTASPAAVEQKQVADDSSELSLDQRMSAFEFDLGFSLFHSDFAKTREAIQKLQGEFKALRSYALNREMQAFLMSPATPPAALVGDADAIWEQAISEVEAGITLAEIKPNHIPGLFQILRSNVRNKRKKSVDTAMAKEKP